jgi:uncharacterized membrane protein
MLLRIKRWLKHRWLQVLNGGKSITPEMLARLQQQVTDSEHKHSGEIRIYLETGLPTSYLWRNAPAQAIIHQRALSVFGKLRVWDTAQNNGVLIYLLLAERSVELVADRGLNERVSHSDWQAMVSSMTAAFSAGQFEQGLSQAIASVSTLLIQHFPLSSGEANPNELPDAPLWRN